MDSHSVYLPAPRSNRSACQESATFTCCGSSTEGASECGSLRAWQVAVGCTVAVWWTGKTCLVTFLWRRGTLQTFMSCICAPATYISVVLRPFLHFGLWGEHVFTCGLKEK